MPPEKPIPGSSREWLARAKGSLALAKQTKAEEAFWEDQGYRPFGDFLATFGPLGILIGANGSGKSSLFEFLKFLRDSLYQDIPPEIIAGSIGQQIFHVPGSERF